jgi:hypothetical protein
MPLPSFAYWACHLSPISCVVRQLRIDEKKASALGTGQMLITGDWSWAVRREQFCVDVVANLSGVGTHDAIPTVLFIVPKTCH